MAGIIKCKSNVRDWFYKTKRWEKTRNAYFAHANGICERCKEKVGKIVHHNIHLTNANVNDLDIAYGFDNLELLCQDCHNAEHFKVNAEVDSGFMFDERGQLIKIPPVLEI